MTTLLDLFDEVLADSADVEAFVQPLRDGATRRITFSEWAEAADGVAAALIASGVQRGDVVAIQLPSGIDYAIAYGGVIRAGAVATGINPRLGRTEIDHITKRCTPRITVDEQAFASLVADGPGDPSARRVDIDASDPVAIVWTGGTTGLPKGAWFDHNCMRAMTDGATPLSETGDRRLSPLPFSHVGYMTRMWDELTHRITTVIVPTPWTAEEALRVIEDETVTVCQGVPTQYRMMLDHPAFDSVDTSSLRLAGIGAARIPPELVTEMKDRLGCPVVVRYASTESCLATGTRLDDPIDTICSTVGRPNGGVDMRIVGDDGTPQPADQVGRVELRSRAMMRGYWNDPERTADAFTDDRWLRTGDLGSIGPDGNLRLAGRSGEMYIRGGYNVYPIEVENCLGDHPDLAATAVVGARVDDRIGEIGVAFAVSGPCGAPTLDDVRRFVKERLADYKAPDTLVLVDELPLTPIGKIDKKQLQPRADEEARTWTR